MDVNKLLADLVRDVEREDARFAAYSPPDRGAAARAAYKTALGRVLAAVEECTARSITRRSTVASATCVADSPP